MDSYSRRTHDNLTKRRCSYVFLSSQGVARLDRLRSVVKIRWRRNGALQWSDVDVLTMRSKDSKAGATNARNELGCKIRKICRRSRDRWIKFKCLQILTWPDWRIITATTVCAVTRLNDKMTSTADENAARKARTSSRKRRGDCHRKTRSKV